MKARNVINTSLRGKKIFKRTILEKTTPLVQTQLIEQLCSNFYLVRAQLHQERQGGENHENEKIKRLIQRCLEIVFLKPQNKNNDLAR